MHADCPTSSESSTTAFSTSTSGAFATPRTAPARHPELRTSEELLQGSREMWIEHRGEIYRLRLTGSGKLYLTK